MNEQSKNLRIAFNTSELLYTVLPTPLVRLEKASIKDTELWAKLEYFNPYSNSVKDRVAYRLLAEALKKKHNIVEIKEASSGNFAIALTLLSNIFGMKTTIYLPKPTPRATEILLKTFGAKVIRTDFETINQDMVKYVKEQASRTGSINLNQFENDLNHTMHYETTAKELFEQVIAAGRKPDYIIIGMGTSGTISAITRFFKENMGDNVNIVGVQPTKNSKIPGLKRLETGPKWISQYKPDMIIDITAEDAVKSAIEIARLEGLPVGLSSGAVYSAYKKLASKQKGVFVVLFSDNAYKYYEIFKKYTRKK